jgi:DNA (cytosine-5)-methyltransferase 1
LVGGTPCQSFSVAGLRKGLEDPRGNLMLTYLAMANHFKPKWLLWENVPGVLSSNKGHDFAALLQGLAELGYGFAYRVFDAQHFGVPQRRRRVFVVGCLGDWRSAAKVLFESESLCRDITPSRSERKEIANCLTKSPSSYSSYNPARSEGNAIICADVAPTITSSGAGWSRPGNAPTEHETYVTYGLAENTIGRQPQNGGNGIGYSENVMYTLNATGVHGVACNVYGFNVNARPDEMKFETEISGTLTCNQRSGVAIDTYNGTIQGDVAATMTSSMAGSSSTGPKVMVTHGISNNPLIGHCLRSGASKADKPDSTTYVTDMRVRRLTPMECERLQGFPDNYTNTPTSSDATRYKALGNSMAVPVMKWIGERIMEIEL